MKRHAGKDKQEKTSKARQAGKDNYKKTSTKRQIGAGAGAGADQKPTGSATLVVTEGEMKRLYYYSSVHTHLVAAFC